MRKATFVLSLMLILVLAGCGSQNNFAAETDTGLESYAPQVSDDTLQESFDSTDENESNEPDQSALQNALDSASASRVSSVASTVSGTKNSKGNSATGSVSLASSMNSGTSVASSSKAASSAASSSLPPAQPRQCVERQDLALELFDRINKYREDSGVGKLTWREQNADIATRQAKYNAENDVPDKAVHGLGQIGTAGPASNSADIPLSALEHWQTSLDGHDETLKKAVYYYGGVSVFEIKKNGVTREFVAILCFDRENFTLPDPGVEQ
ncbi:MAG: CAP domain-containing protein [Oscillospiraceae bacterium]|jgi:uncharacterized protein YkwD|nr:CAP domain-containing protein [Oscillospiraceae bacterium]